MSEEVAATAGATPPIDIVVSYVTRQYQAARLEFTTAMHHELQLEEKGAGRDHRPANEASGIRRQQAQRRRAKAKRDLDAAKEACQAAMALRAEANRKPTPSPDLVMDTEGFDLRPDPLAARTPADLVDALRQFRMWAGQASYRTMAARCRQRVAASTLCTALSCDDMPTLNVVIAIVTGCGGSEADQRAFATAWRKIQLPRADSAQAERADSALEERPALRVVTR